MAHTTSNEHRKNMGENIESDVQKFRKQIGDT